MVDALKFKPTTYQQRAIDRIISQQKLGLFLPMGMGKTAIALESVRQLGTKTLVIAPLRVAKWTWTAENEKWNFGLRISVVVGDVMTRQEALAVDADVYVINREMVAWLFQQNNLPTWDMLVLDESTSFKNPSSQRFRTLKRNIKKFSRVLLLTGTPIANNLLDLWAQIYLIDKGERLGSGITKYRQRWFKVFRYVHNIPIYKEPLPNAQEEIINLISDVTVTMQKDDAKELDRVKVVDEYVSIPLMNEYRKMKHDYIIGDVLASNAAVALGKLQQIANGFLYGSDIHHEEKLEVIKDLLDSGDPLLVFYQYQEDRERLKKLGGVELTDETVDEWNAGRVPMLLAHPASAGFGLNLQHGGHIIVWYSLPWSYEQYAQGNARLDRTGQTKQVLIYRILARGTVDEVVARQLEQKKSVSDYLLDCLKEA